MLFLRGSYETPNLRRTATMVPQLVGISRTLEQWYTSLTREHVLKDEGSFDQPSYKLATVIAEIIRCLGKIGIEFGDHLATTMTRGADNGKLRQEIMGTKRRHHTISVIMQVAFSR